MSSTLHPTGKIKIKILTFVISLLTLLALTPGNALRLNNFNVSTSYAHQGPLHLSSTTSSMELNYNQQILKLGEQEFALAADINSRISTVESQYLGHQKEIKMLGQYQPFEIYSTESVSCDKTNPNTLQSLLWKTTQMRKYLEKVLINNEVNFIQSQEERNSVKKNIQEQIVYLQALQKFLDSGCQKPIKIEKSLFVSNPNANNWILGDWTYQQFIDHYIKTMNQNSKVSKCPLDRPFFDGKSCINCRYPDNVWDMKTSQCTSCPYSLIVNVKTRRCVSEIQYVNNIMDESHPWVSDRPLNKVFDEYQQQKGVQSSIICPFYTPFILNEKCSTCPSGLIYYLEEHKCISIPYNMEYDPNLHRIVEKLYNYQINTEISGNIKEGLFSCPAQFPYYDNITCINCQFPFYFNQRLMACEKCSDLNDCPSGKRQLVYTSNYLASPLTGASTAQVQQYKKQQKQLLQREYTLQCPIQFPFYYPSARKCASCSKQAPLFNITNYMCAACPPESSYNEQSYLCERALVKTNSNAPGILVEDWSQYQKENAQSKGKECPMERPYSSQNRCIPCPQTRNIFNVSSQECTRCPQNTQYDSQKYQCVQVQFAGYKSNSKAYNFWTFNQSQYLKNYQQSSLEECPEETPFSVGKKCITCAQEQIFNTSSLQCSNCPQETEFNVVYNNCTRQKPRLYVPGRTDKLIGTVKYPVKDYLQFYEKAKQDDKYELISCEQLQYSTKKDCIECPQQSMYFNVSSLSCVECQEYDESTNRCFDHMHYLTNLQAGKSKLLGQEEGDVETYSSQINKKLQVQPYIYRPCPNNTPFFTGQQCVACEDYFNVKTQTCQFCQQIQTITLTCKPLSTKYLSNLKTKFPYYTADRESFAKKYTEEKEKGMLICPFDTPFYDGTGCISCTTHDDYFNLDSQVCQSCGQGEQFNQFVWECQQDPTPQYTSLDSKKLLYDGQPKAYFEYKNDQSKEAGGTECPQDKPYYTAQQQCGVCPENKPLFNMLTRRCTTCRQGSAYNEESRQCETPIGDYVTPETSLEKSLANLFT